MADSKRHRDRLAMGDGAIYSLQVASELLPPHDSRAREWLIEQGLVQTLLGVPIVVWADVQQRIREIGEPSPTRPRTPLRLPRENL